MTYRNPYTTLLLSQIAGTDSLSVPPSWFMPEDGTRTTKLSRMVDFHSACQPSSLYHGALDIHILTPTKCITHRVCDFGLTELREAGTMAGSVSTISSVAWTAPEVLDDEECSVGSDIYSFGILIHEMLTCRIPFAGKGVAKVCCPVKGGGGMMIDLISLIVAR